MSKNASQRRKSEFAARRVSSKTFVEKKADRKSMGWLDVGDAGLNKKKLKQVD